MNKPRRSFKKKNYGCPAWVIDGVRAIREAAAAKKPIPPPQPQHKNGLQATTGSEA
jgi:hypothetical protein